VNGLPGVEVRCYVELGVLALSVHTVCHVDLVVAVSNGDPDGFCVCEMSERNFVQVDAHAYCNAER